MIGVKDKSVLRELTEVPSHPILLDVIDFILERYPDITFTSGYRAGDPGVHGTIPCRGRDIRSAGIPDPENVAAWINMHWRYDPARPTRLVAVYHRVKKPDGSWGGRHFHIQVHPNTIHTGIAVGRI